GRSRRQRGPDQEPQAFFHSCAFSIMSPYLPMVEARRPTSFSFRSSIFLSFMLDTAWRYPNGAGMVRSPRLTALESPLYQYLPRTLSLIWLEVMSAMRTQVATLTLLLSLIFGKQTSSFSSLSLTRYW